MQIAHEMYLLMHFANEPQSTKAILNKVESYNYPYTKKVVILNCRSDRVDRTRQFVENFIDDVDFDTLICTGKSTQMVTDLMQHLPDKNILILKTVSSQKLRKPFCKSHKTHSYSV